MEIRPNLPSMVAGLTGNAPSISGLKIGAVLNALVQAALPDNRFLLKLLPGEQLLTARSHTHLEQGRVLNLEVVRLGAEPELRIRLPESSRTTTRLIQDTLLRSLPSQQSLAELPSALLQIGRAAPHKLGPALQSQAAQLLADLPTLTDLATPDGLRRAMQHSGLLYEASLAQVITQGRAYPDADLKGRILRLMAALNASETDEGATDAPAVPKGTAAPEKPAAETTNPPSSSLAARPSAKTMATSPPLATSDGEEALIARSAESPAECAAEKVENPPEREGKTGQSVGRQSSEWPRSDSEPPNIAAGVQLPGKQVAAAPIVPVGPQVRLDFALAEAAPELLDDVTEPQANTASTPVSKTEGGELAEPGAEPAPVGVPANRPAENGLPGKPMVYAAPTFHRIETTVSHREMASDAVRPSADGPAELPAAKLEGVLSRITLDQLASIPSNDGTFTWNLQIPYFDGNRPAAMELSVRAEATGTAMDPAKRLWSVMLELSPPGLGRFAARILWNGERVDAYLWSDSADTAALIQHHEEQLRVQLEMAGLTVGHLLGLDEAPEKPAAAPKPAASLLDLRA